MPATPLAPWSSWPSPSCCGIDCGPCAKNGMAPDAERPLRPFGYFPQSDRRLPQREMAGQALARHGPLDALLHAGKQRAVTDHLEEDGPGVAHVEEVTLPGPLEIAGVAKPAPAQPGDLIVRAVGPGGVGHLLPQAEDLALLVVDEHLLVRVRPPFQTGHLEPQSQLADLLPPDGHELVVRPGIPPIGGILGIEVRHVLPVLAGFPFAVHL